MYSRIQALGSQFITGSGVLMHVRCSLISVSDEGVLDLPQTNVFQYLFVALNFLLLIFSVCCVSQLFPSPCFEGVDGDVKLAVYLALQT